MSACSLRCRRCRNPPISPRAPPPCLCSSPYQTCVRPGLPLAPLASRAIPARCRYTAPAGNQRRDGRRRPAYRHWCLLLLSALFANTNERKRSYTTPPTLPSHPRYTPPRDLSPVAQCSQGGGATLSVCSLPLCSLLTSVPAQGPVMTFDFALKIAALLLMLTSVSWFAISSSHPSIRSISGDAPPSARRAA